MKTLLLITLCTICINNSYGQKLYVNSDYYTVTNGVQERTVVTTNIFILDFYNKTISKFDGVKETIVKFVNGSDPNIYTTNSGEIMIISKGKLIFAENTFSNKIYTVFNVLKYLEK